MAIIKCVECNGNVSDKARSCPHCGVDVEYILDKTTIYIPNDIFNFSDVELDLNKTNIVFYPYEMHDKYEFISSCEKNYPHIQFICIDDIDAGDENTWYEKLQIAKENNDLKNMYKYYKLLAMHIHRCWLLAEDRKNMYHVGRMILLGIGTEQNILKALFWLRKAVEPIKNNWEYYCDLGEEPPPSSAAPLPSACLLYAQVCSLANENNSDSIYDQTVYLLLETGANSYFDYYYDEEEMDAAKRCAELLENIKGFKNS